MSLEAKYNQHHDENILACLENLDNLEQVASAAGHGYMVPPTFNAGWVEVQIDPNNVRPSYDLNHIATFSPALVKALLFELSEARKTIAGLRAEKFD